MEKEVKSNCSERMESYPLLVNVVDQLYSRYRTYMDVLGRSGTAKEYPVFFEEVLAVVYPSTVRGRERKGSAI